MSIPYAANTTIGDEPRFDKLDDKLVLPDRKLAEMIDVWHTRKCGITTVEFFVYASWPFCPPSKGVDGSIGRRNPKKPVELSGWRGKIQSVVVLIGIMVGKSDCWKPKGSSMILKGMVISGVLLMLVTSAFSQPLTLVIAPPELSVKVEKSEADVFYQAIISHLGKLDNVNIVERSKLKLIMDELDLGLVFNPDASGQLYAKAAAKLSADTVLVPGISKLDHDYFLSLRQISVSKAATQACLVKKTRLTSKFAECAEAMINEILAKSPSASTSTLPDKTAIDVDIENLRQECKNAKADQFFPALWERTEKLYKTASSGKISSDLASYYIALIRYLASASTPPEGMVFIPGGYVTVKTPTGQKKLWVEPFFIDHYETSVAEYKLFLASAKHNPDFLPITQNHPQFSDDLLPVTGISFPAAESYAEWCRKQLPTLPQWIRASGPSLKTRPYPCGNTAAASKSNLKGTDDGYSCLAPANAPGVDVSVFGVVGLTGNVREWTSTWFSPELYSKSPDTSAKDPAQGTLKIVTGGSWRTDMDSAKINSFEKHKPREAFDDVGFRCIIPFFASQ